MTELNALSVKEFVISSPQDLVVNLTPLLIIYMT